MVFCGIYVLWEQNNVNYVSYENKGCTDIIKGEQNNITKNYPAFETNVNELIQDTTDTDLNIHLLINQFYNNNNIAEYSYNQLNSLTTALTTALNDFPRINGISFDDFYYNAANHDPEKIDDEIEFLSDFAGTVKDTIKEVDNNILLSSATPVSDVYGFSKADHTPIFDFVIPSIYRYYNTSPTFISSNLTTYLSGCNNSNVVVGLLTFHNDNDVRMWDLSVMVDDIQTCLSENCGYVLFIYPWIHLKQYFPYKVYNGRLFSNRAAAVRTTINRTQLQR